MSEKYTTREIVEDLANELKEANEFEHKPKWREVNNSITNTIIASLRAADKLCEAAKSILEITFMAPDGDFLSQNRDKDEIIDELRKAIADYEERK